MRTEIITPTHISKPKKKLLYEVSLIRPLVIFLLIFLHSFTKIQSGGMRSNDFILPEFYQWMCYLISGFRIETIALVAGYVFAYQSIVRNRKYEFKPFVIKKFKRLILPMLFFGMFYYFMFLNSASSFSVGNFAIKWFSGCGHLWFLPMLFWCFLAIWVIDHFHFPSVITLCAFALLAILPIPVSSIPLGFSKLPHFLFFVYGGYFLYLHHKYVQKHWLSHKHIIVFWCSYVVFVVIRQLFLPSASNFSSVLETAIWRTATNSMDLLISCMGIIALYSSFSRITVSPAFKPKQWIIRASDFCYGVYVFHQFILVYLYHYTPIVSEVDPWALPWIGFVIAFTSSWVLTELSLHTRFGRYLIG